VKIDAENITERILALKVAAAIISRCRPVEGKVYI